MDFGARACVKAANQIPLLWERRRRIMNRFIEGEERGRVAPAEQFVRLRRSR